MLLKIWKHIENFFDSKKKKIPGILQNYQKPCQKPLWTLKKIENFAICVWKFEKNIENSTNQISNGLNLGKF